MKIFMWNIKSGLNPRGNEYNFSKVISFLKNYPADIYCLNEVDKRFGKRSNWDDQELLLMRMLGYNSFFIPAVGKEFGNLIFCKTSISTTKIFSLPYVYSYREKRKLAKVKIKHEGHLFTLYFTHLDFEKKTNIVQFSFIRNILSFDKSKYTFRK